METGDIRGAVASCPNVKRLVGDIPPLTPMYEAGVLVREKLMSAGFRRILDGENVTESLNEAEKWLTEARQEIT